MRAFSIAWRAIVSLYNELFFLLTINLIWWVTGGIFVAFAGVVVLVPGLGLPLWMAPLFAIPAGPAGAGLANVARQVARDLHVDRDFYWNGFRAYWRPALALNALSMVILSLLLLNIQFYMARGTAVLEVFAILWVYLTALWLGAVLYLPAVIAGLKELTVPAALRTVAVLAFANPLYTFILLVLAGALTALCVVITILLPLVWPALMALLGEHSLMLFMERVGGKGNGHAEGKGTA